MSPNRATLLHVHIVLVVNPRASRVTASRRRSVEAQLSRHHTLSIVETDGRDHATELASAAVCDGADAIAVLGGDGTLNEVANALVGTDRVLIALPGGGTNVFCRTLGFGDDQGAAAAAASKALRLGAVRRIGMGEVRTPTTEPRSFVINTGIGWDAALVSVVERHAPLKRHLGHGLFIYAGLRTFFADYDRRRQHFQVEFDGGEVIEDGYFALVLNSDPYTYVGHRPFSVDPTNSADVPFTVVVLRSMSSQHFLTVMAEALRGGGISPRPWLEIRRQVEALSIRRSTTAPYQVDGDHLGDAAELHLTYRPDSLSVAVPPG